MKLKARTYETGLRDQQDVEEVLAAVELRDQRYDEREHVVEAQVAPVVSEAQIMLGLQMHLG